MVGGGRFFAVGIVLVGYYSCYKRYMLEIVSVEAVPFSLRLSSGRCCGEVPTALRCGLVSHTRIHPYNNYDKALSDFPNGAAANPRE